METVSQGNQEVNKFRSGSAEQQNSHEAPAVVEAIKIFNHDVKSEDEALRYFRGMPEDRINDVVKIGLGPSPYSYYQVEQGADIIGHVKMRILVDSQSGEVVAAAADIELLNNLLLKIKQVA